MAGGRIVPGHRWPLAQCLVGMTPVAVIVITPATVHVEPSEPKQKRSKAYTENSGVHV